MKRAMTWMYIGALLAPALFFMSLDHVEARQNEHEYRTNNRQLITILSPSPYHTVNGPRIDLKVRLRFDADPASFKATLNGRDISRRFTPALYGVRTATALPYQLKRGKNVLRVSARNAGLGWLGGDTVRFDVARLLAPDENFPHLGDTSSAVPLVPITTRVISGDGTQASDYGIQVGTEFYQAQNPPGGGATGFQVLLLDRATLDLVSNTSYSTATETLTQNFVADLQNLSLPGCGEYGCLMVVQSLEQPGWTTCGNVSPLDKPCGSSSFNPAEALPGSILSQYGGTTAISYVPFPGRNVGYSLITTLTLQDTKTGTKVIGRGPGQGWERLGCAGPQSCLKYVWGVVSPDTGTGQISGYLVLDKKQAYQFTYGPGGGAIATGTGKSATTNTMTVEGSPLTSATTSAGFQVVVLNRTTLAVKSNTTYTMSELGSMATTLALLDENKLVMISSIGKITNPNTADYLNVGALLSSFGGTPHVFYNLHNDDYALVGARTPASTVSEPPFFGAEASSYISKQIQPLGAPPLPSNISGVLTQDNRGYYRVFPWRIMAPSVTAAQYDTQFVNRIEPYAFTPPTAWPVPETGNTSQVNAYTWISSCVTRGTSPSCPATAADANADIRADYGLKVLLPAPDSTGLSLWSTNIGNIACPSSPSPVFDCTAFAQVQAQLVTETNYASRIATLAGNQLALLNQVNSDQAELLTSANTLVNDAFQPSSGSNMVVDLVSGAAGLLTIASAIDFGAEIQVALDAASVATGFGLTLGSQVATGGSPYNRLATTFGNLNADVAGAFEDAMDIINNNLNLIVSDWGRLQSLGVALQDQLDSGSPWYFDKDTILVYQNTIATSLLGSYATSLLLGEFQMVRLMGQGEGAPPDADALHNYYKDCNAAFCFLGFPSHAWRSVAVGTGPTPPTTGNDGRLYDQYLIASSASCPKDYPSTSVMPSPPLPPMFAPLDPNWTLGDGFPNLGLYDIWFFMHAPTLVTDPQPRDLCF